MNKRIVRVLTAAVAVIGMLGLTSCGGSDTADEKEFNASMKKLDQYKRESGKDNPESSAQYGGSRAAAQKELDAMPTHNPDGSKIQSMSIEDLNKMSE